MDNNIKKLEKSKKYLPISCLCSIYINTTYEEILLALKSILVQDILPKQIIIVVDGPIKNKIQIFINHLISEYKIFKIVYSYKNEGLGLALKKGLEFCDYDIIARFDSDDINLKDRLAKQYSYLSKNKNIDILGTYVKEFNIKDNKIFSRLKIVPQTDIKIKAIMSSRNPMNHPTIMFRKKAIIRSGSYISMNCFEDYYLWLRCKSKNFIFYNSDYPSVAMKRECNIERRHGFKYGYHECRFFFICFLKGLIPFHYLIVLIIRVGLRITPKIFSKIFYDYDKRRTNFKIDENLNLYIEKLNKFRFKYENN